MLAVARVARLRNLAWQDDRKEINWKAFRRSGRSLMKPLPQHLPEGSEIIHGKPVRIALSLQDLSGAPVEHRGDQPLDFNSVLIHVFS